MSSAPTCHYCKTTTTAAAPDTLTRIGFRDSCEKCGSDLHVCLNCRFYDDQAHHECREPSAEWVRNKDRNNVCEYFRLKTVTTASAPSEKARAMSALDDLFKK